MTQGTITTVHQGQVISTEAQNYLPAEINIDATIARQQASLERSAKAGLNPLAMFFVRLGRRIKRFFTYNPAGKRPRAWELDILRGLMMLGVTIDHCASYMRNDELIPAYTIVGYWFKSLADAYHDWDLRNGIQPFALWLFAMMAGINCSFTRSRFHRVFKFWILCALFMGGYALLHVIWPELVTSYFIFNIIAVLTICFTVWWVLDLIKCPTWIRGYLGAILIIIGLNYYYTYYVIETEHVTNTFLSLMVYSTLGRSLSPQNFEPLLPHLGFFLVGGVLGKYLYADRKTKCKSPIPPKGLTPLLLLGKHSLVGYITLPFIILGIARGIAELVGMFVG